MSTIIKAQEHVHSVIKELVKEGTLAQLDPIAIGRVEAALIGCYLTGNIDETLSAARDDIKSSRGMAIYAPVSINVTVNARTDCSVGGKGGAP